jgi:hypothetical protein
MVVNVKLCAFDVRGNKAIAEKQRTDCNRYIRRIVIPFLFGDRDPEALGTAERRTVHRVSISELRRSIEELASECNA